MAAGLQTAKLRAGAVIPARLTFEGVSRVFGSTEVLRDVSFEVAEAEVICLLGPSGCGKSTLLRIAAGIDEPDAGRVFLDGREVAGPERMVPPEERGVGLVFQDYALFPHLSILENVTFGLRHLSRREARAAALNALARVGLDGFAAAQPHMLSGGEQQRVALTRAIVPRPGVLLMDEPFSNLDRRMRDAVRDETVALLRETGATAIIVTHDPEEAMRIADRIVLMRRGRILQFGSAQDLYRQPQGLAAARFFCELNEITAVAEDGVASTCIGRFPAPVNGGPVVVCVRPQAIRLRPPGFCLPGRLVDLRFLGEVVLAEVAVQGLEGTLKARLRSMPHAAAGDEVGLDIDPDEVLVFAADDP